MKTRIVFAVLLTALSLIFTVAASAGPAMDKILKNKELVIGTTGTQPPMTGTTKTGDIIGLDIDISKAMAKAMGVKIKFVTLPFNELLPALEAGKVDMVVSGMTMTPGRNKKVAFVGPYYVSGKGILAVAKKYVAMQNAEGLNSIHVAIAALKDSTSQQYAETVLPKADLTLTDSMEKSIDLLFKGDVDVVVADFPSCALTAYRYPDKNLIAGESPLTFEPLGIALAEDTLLINWVENFLVMLQGSGELKKMGEKWFTGGAWVDELK
jgi:polar amino acid transport system substrate-binding protein